MTSKVVGNAGGRAVHAMDSITSLTNSETGQIVVSGSHGGRSSGGYALGTPLAAVFFNDAGVGKDDAGIVALRMLQQAGVAAGTVSNMTARIGDAEDHWKEGVLSHVNQAAADRGIVPGRRLQDAVLEAFRAA